MLSSPIISTVLFIFMSCITVCKSFFTTSAKITRRRRHQIIPSMSTQYTINDEVCAPVDEGELRKIVTKHCRSLETFLESRPIAAHTRDAFSQIHDRVDAKRKVILDSGCGTGRSTLLLGEMYPDHTIIGIDRSFVRLNRNSLTNEKSDKTPIPLLSDDTDGESNNDVVQSSQRPFQAVSSNVILVRAELTDFWRCVLQTNWNISHHYIFYPNPYPKKNRIKKRFYAHPSFPLILKIGGSITLRSNWEGYLKEFAQSVVFAYDFYYGEGNELNCYENIAMPYYKNALEGPNERIDKSIAWTNFEKKYDDVGEKTYELIL